MQTVDQLLAEANSALSQHGYYRKCDILSRGKHHIKFRLLIERDLFVQVNRNERTSITNFSLISKVDRIYGRDEYQGHWHRHPAASPQGHNSSQEGQRPVTLGEFLAEVDEVLREKGLA